jgi:hypothetical protein
VVADDFRHAVADDSWHAVADDFRHAVAGEVPRRRRGRGASRDPPDVTGVDVGYPLMDPTYVGAGDQPAL